MNWLLFYVWAFLLGALLYIPGIVWYSRLSEKSYLVLAFAPSFTIIVLALSMTMTELIGCRLPWCSYVALLAVLTALGAWINRSSLQHFFDVPPVNGKKISSAPFYLGVAFVLVTWIYVKNLNGHNSILPMFDNAHTLSLIQTFSETDCYGPILSSVYFDSPQMFQGLSYYPAALHSICALIGNMSGCGTPEALNIMTFDILFLMLPLSVRSLVKVSFSANKAAEWFGAFSPFVFYAFPWGLLIFGPLQTNLMGLSLVPAVLASMVSLFEGSSKKRLVDFGLCLVGLAALALCHPGALFSAGVLSIPLILMSIMNIDSIRTGGWRIRLVTFLLVIIAISAIWLVCFNLPFLKGVVDFTWSAAFTPSEAFSSVMGLSFLDSVAQPLVVATVAVGVFFCLRSGGRSSWLVASALIVSIIYCVDMSTDGWFKQLLGGFWYTDSRRIAAMLVIPLMPLFSVGIGSIFTAVKRFVEAKPDSLTSPQVMGIGVVLLLLFLSFGPDISLYGVLNIPSAICQARSSLASLNTPENYRLRDGATQTVMLDTEELEAGREISQIVDGSGMILNNAFDGSVFYYSLYGMNLVFRTCGSGVNGDPNSELSKRAAEYTSDSYVKSNIESDNIRYVLQLDSGVSPSTDSTFELNYNPADWIGIQSISPDTPGFELVYSRGDIRLYRLTDL